MRKTPIVAFVDVDPLPPPAATSRGPQARMLELLARERIMLVFYSAKTRAQIESARQAFGVFHPFIAEGGAAVFLPERYFGSDLENTRNVGGYQAVEFATPYDTVVDLVRRAAERLNIGVLGFSDMSVEQVARECGMSLLEARLAKLREYSEPFRLLAANPVAERRLVRALESAGLVCRRGDPFHVATGAKGAQPAIALLAAGYRAAFGSVLTASAVDGAGADQLAPHTDLSFGPIALDAGDPPGGPGWLERIVEESDKVRVVQHAARTARMAR